jgi:hypothetical protein
MYYIGLDVHKKTISYCVKDAAGQVHREGKIGTTRCELDAWIKTLPQPRTMAMEATMFTGWIYDYLLPHAEKVKVAHPLMLRAIAAAKKKNAITLLDESAFQLNVWRPVNRPRSRPIGGDSLGVRTCP